ncbi:MAG: hypothetical protein PHC88_11735 [Terrimicrobiaceae bacterium]|nr:hypothetical protein [Terrimicrobiaceae bacterium]
MRAAISLRLFAILLATATAALALPTDRGKVLKGRYVASGSASVAGVTVRYLPSNVHVDSHGHVKGFVNRVVITRTGVLLENGFVRLHGNTRSLTLRSRKGTFTAPAVLRLDGAVFKGSFNGLSDRSQRLSRYFHGKISGSKNSTFLLRSR